jgi:hypothetical protein
MALKIFNKPIIPASAKGLHNDVRLSRMQATYAPGIPAF